MSVPVPRLDGWKEIACYLKRSVRCVQRWERYERLPVRRHGHPRGASVYAFREELDAWWQNVRHSARQSLGESALCLAHRPTKAKGSQDPARTAPGTSSPGNWASNPDHPPLEQLAWEVAVIFLKILESLAHRESGRPEASEAFDWRALLPFPFAAPTC